MKKILTLLMSTLMLLTSTGMVFADEPENPNIKPTELSYEVTEGYEWSVPTKLEFTAENFADVVATDDSGDASKIAISKCTLTADKTLLIEVDAAQVFEIAESNGHTLDYAVKANDVSVGAGDVVLSLDSGEECDGVDTEIKGTLTKDANEIAGDYSGTLTFLAEIVRGGKAIKVVADGTTATNVRFTAMPTNKQDALKADLKLAGTSSLSDAELAAALVIDIDADTAGDVKMDISRLANEGDKVLVYHKSSTNGWELLGEAEVGADGTVTCSFTDYSPILVSKKSAEGSGTIDTITDLTGYTWTGNDTLTKPIWPSYVSINYNSNGQSFTLIQLNNGPSNTWAIMFSTSVYPYGVNAGGGSWAQPEYKTIHITGGTDTTNLELIAWLQANGTLTK